MSQVIGGKEYMFPIICPKCGKVNEYITNPMYMAKCKHCGFKGYEGDFRDYPVSMTINNCRQEVKDFAVAMEEVLRKNDHKIHWSKVSTLELYSYFGKNVSKLNDNIGGLDNLCHNCVDIANYAMMLWDKDREK